MTPEQLKDEKARLKKKEIKLADKEFEENQAIKRKLYKEKMAAQTSAPKEFAVQIQSEEGIKSKVKAATKTEVKTEQKAKVEHKSEQKAAQKSEAKSEQKQKSEVKTEQKTSQKS